MITKTKKKVVKKKATKKRVRKKRDGRLKEARGRKPIKLDAKQLKLLSNAAGSGCTYIEMAVHVGIGKDTLRELRDDAKTGVQKTIDRGKALGVIKAKHKLFKVATTMKAKDFKQVHLNALEYYLNNNSEYTTQLDVGDSQVIPASIDISDDDAVKAYMDTIKKPV